MKNRIISCPSCGHEFVNKAAPPASTKGAAVNQDVGNIEAWHGRLSSITKIKWSASKDLYDLYLAMCPDLDSMSLRRFSAALLACGWKYKRTSDGRVYRP